MHQNNLNLSSQNFVVYFLRFNLQFIDKYEIQEVAEYLFKEYSCNRIFALSPLEITINFNLN